MKYILLFFVPFFLSSCFEIIEKVEVNEDGSGEFQVIFNFSQSKTKIGTMLMLDEVKGYKVPSIKEITGKINAVADSIKTCKGIKNVKTVIDNQNYIVDFSCSFDHVNRLNDVIFRLQTIFKTEYSRRDMYVRYADGYFYRFPGASMLLLKEKIQKNDPEFLEGATYTSVYKFEKEITARTNTRSKLSNNKKVVFFQSPIKHLISKPELIKNKVSTN